MQHIAIVGIGGLFPGDGDTEGCTQTETHLETFWKNIQTGRDCSRVVPDDRWLLSKDDAWSFELAADKVNSIRGCFLDTLQLDPTGLDLDKNILAKLDPMFHILLHAGRQAWQDINNDNIDKQRVGIIIGNIVLPTDSSSALADETLGPAFESQLLGKRPEENNKTESLNRYVAGLPAGVLAKALGLGGGTYTLDAACASSLYALKYAVEELIAGRADAMLTGGLSRPDCLYTQMGFSALGAISKTGHCSPFDHKGDGLLVGEGAGILVLKRLDDALRDQDHIYATVAGVGLSNDIGGNLMSPDSEGQLRAMQAAYHQANWSPEDVDLIECHGTGTPIGDAEEIKSLKSLWPDHSTSKQRCVIGSVKSNIGHLLTAAGSAGLIKVLLAMKHQQLPPTANFENTSAKIDLAESPFTVLSDAKFWGKRTEQTPRRAAVSAFGFGGINAHVLLEEWQTEQAVETSNATELAPASEIKIAIVGMETQFGPWKSLAAFKERLFTDKQNFDAELPKHWWGIDNPDQIKGWFISEVNVPLGRYRIPPAELKEMLPQQLLMLEVAANALRDAGIEELSKEESDSTGVFIGIGLDLNTTNYHFRWSLLNRAKSWARQLDLKLNDRELDDWTQSLRDAAGPALNANRTMGALGGIVASRIARAFRIGGPSFTVSSEESSGLRALEAGIRALQRGELNTAIVGAADLAGDVRAALGHHASRAYSSDTFIGEGATAFILKRHEDAIRDGDRIYSVIKGIGAASGGANDLNIPTEIAYITAFNNACRDANTNIENIHLFETHGSGHPQESAMEMSALKELFAGFKGKPIPTISEIKSKIGHTGAACGLASVAKASLSLYHKQLTDGDETHYWLRNKIDGPRQAAVSTFSVDGNCLHAILEEADQHSGMAILKASETLFTFHAETKESLLENIKQLDSLVSDNHDTNSHVTGKQTIYALAKYWWQSNKHKTQNKFTATVVSHQRNKLSLALRRLQQSIEQNESINTDGIYFSTKPLGKKGKLAFVYPGSGNHFHGMGRDLGQQWPSVINRLDDENDSLAAQFANGRFWQDSDNNPWGSKTESTLTHEEVIFGQVWLGTFVSDVITQFGIKPDAIIGYSLGETAGLFSTRSWTDRDEMLRRIQETDLFSDALAGPCDSVRDTWQLKESEAVDWMIGVIDQAADKVKRALVNHSRTYLLITNTPNECVVGGDKDSVLALVKELKCNFHPIQGVTTVHCEVANPVKKSYRDLHLFETNPPRNISFYSGVWGRSYKVTRDSAADSIVEQAVQPFDYTKVIQSAYEDGVRLFVEMGPGATCSRMIDQILKDKTHVAKAICVKNQDSVANVIHCLGRLIAEGIAVDLHTLFQFDENQVISETSYITVKTGSTGFNVPPLPGQKTHDQKNSNEILDKKATQAPVETLKTVVATNNVHLLQPVIEQMQLTENAKAEVQETFLRVSNGLTEILGQALEMEMHLLEDASLRSTRIEPIHFKDAATEHADENCLFNRDQCMEIAIGSIGKVLGPKFVEIDQHPTRVRLPNEPLMLVDRIMEIHGQPASLPSDPLTSGSIITEHDVLHNGWYLDGGRIPTCIAVEAGQADLFLSGYLGIDHITKGLAVYRLLDAKITFHGSLPKPGKVIRYNIQINQFFKQDETYLFRFSFEGTVDGQPLLTMTEGCAGFFTQAELDAGKGIVQTELEKRPQTGRLPDNWQAPVSMCVESYNDQQLNALREGKLNECFGDAFSNLSLHRAVGLPGGRMTLVHRILNLDPAAGRFSIGQITGEADIHPDDWFLTCHFSDDQVMPGTLMYECCLHTLRVYLLRMGWVGEQDEIVYEPIIGEVSYLKCRGQVIESTKKVQYEITLKEIGYQDDGTPYVLADALMFADGRPIVQMNNMSVQLSGLNIQKIENLWQDKSVSQINNQNAKNHNPVKNVLFDFDSIYAFANGKPSEAFGDRYKVFDEERKIARLPRPPYQFLDRITSIKDCEQWELKAGGVIEAEYDVPEDEWYFKEDRQTRMPFAILLEVALQPCGWLAAYLGSALTSDIDLSFRNLGGNGTQLLAVTPTTGTLTTRIKITNVSQSGGMIIQNYDMEVCSDKGVVYKGDTYFGFFSKQSLADQVGIRDTTFYDPDEASYSRGTSFPYPNSAPYPNDMMRMVNDITLFDPQGGPSELGFIRGTTLVDPETWFFKAHFYEDPVWPGSLGLESFIQLLKIVAMEQWGSDENLAECDFEVMALNETHHWIYRGQIIPKDVKVTVQAVITELNQSRRLIRADGFLIVDGRIIYQMNDFALRIA